jgi:hypothetical protein
MSKPLSLVNGLAMAFWMRAVSSSALMDTAAFASW